MRRFATVLAAVVLLLVLVPVTNAATQGPNGTQGGCQPMTTAKVLAWENISSDHSDGDDNLWVCGNIPRLIVLAHTPPGDCNTANSSGLTWDKCIDSATYYLPSGWSACVWTGENYSGSLIQTKHGPITGQRFDFPSQFRDSASSIRILHAASCT